MINGSMDPNGKIRYWGWRFELKYRLNWIQYHKMRAAIRPYMRTDYYTRVAPRNRYLVRSLYFDDYDHRAFLEKMDGDSDRVKFRLRTYSVSVSADSVVKVELKVRKGNAMIKHGSLVSLADLQDFLRKKHWPETDDPVLIEFERYLHLKSLQPQILIEYFREGFEDRAKSDLRVTFDHRVRSAHCAELFPSSPVFFRSHHPHGIVLEIKGRRLPPSWLRRMVREHGLKILANSKFTQGILAARQELYHPDGVVVIR